MPAISGAENSGAFLKNAINPSNLRRSKNVVWVGCLFLEMMMIDIYGNASTF
jgi:hypothetical protein